MEAFVQPKKYTSSIPLRKIRARNLNETNESRKSYIASPASMNRALDRLATMGLFLTHIKRATLNPETKIVTNIFILLIFFY